MRTTQMLSALVIAGALAASPAMSQGMAQSDNTNARTTPQFNTWMQDYSRTNNGRISRQAYMDEAGRRWDAMDTNHQGLTYDQINSVYGYGPSPNRVKTGTQKTNPTGTEMKGENSGGK